MFERCTESARRAIFFARYITVMNEAPGIDSTHLLYSVMWEDNSRANALFRLREFFPMYRGGPYKCSSHELVKAVNPPLAGDSRKAITRAIVEADAMNDFWIDTEHLLLGILSEPMCMAAQHLAKAGFQLADARRIIIENKASRPDYMADLGGRSWLKRARIKWDLFGFRINRTSLFQRLR